MARLGRARARRRLPAIAVGAPGIVNVTSVFSASAGGVSMGASTLSPADGDYRLIAFQTTSTVSSPPAGWDLLYSSTPAGTTRYVYGRKFVASTDTSTVTWTFAANAFLAAAYISLRGYDGSDVIDMLSDTPVTDTTTTPQAPAVTPAALGLVVDVMFLRRATTGADTFAEPSPPAGMSRVLFARPGATNGYPIYVGGSGPNPDALSTRTYTSATQTENYAPLTLLLRGATTALPGALAGTTPALSGALTGTADTAPVMVTDRGTTANATAGTTSSVSLTSPTTIAVGNYLIARVAVDNSGSSGAAPGCTVTDARNTWTVLGPALADPGAAAAGATAYIAYAEVVTAYQAADSLTFNWGGISTTAKAIVVEEWSGISGTTPVAVSAVTASGASTTPAVSITPTAVGQLVYTCLAVEGIIGDTFTGDSDTTNGSWTSLTRAASANATATNNQLVEGQYKIVTASGAQSWGATITSRDWAALAVVFDPTVSALVETLTDAFASADSAKWSYVADTTISSGRLSIAAQDSYPALWSVTRWSLAGSSAFVRLVTPPTTPAITYWGFSLDTTGSGDEITWRWDNGALLATKRVGGSDTTVASTTYSATNHKYLRIRESAGTTYWDTSADSVTWSNFTSTANPIAPAALYPFIGAGGGGGASSALWDDFDVATDSGALAGTTPMPSGALTSAGVTPGALAGTTPMPVWALAGEVVGTAVLAAITPTLSGALTGDVSAGGALASTTSPPTGVLAAGVSDLGVLAGSISPTSGALTAGVTDTGALAGAVPASSGALTGTETQTGVLSGATSPAAGVLAGTVTQTGVLAGTTSPAIGSLTSSNVTTGALAGATPALSGALAGTVVDLGALAGATSPTTGALAGGVVDSGALAGTTSPVAGSLAGTVTASGTLAGTTPPAAAALAGTVTQTGALAGTSPMPVASLISGSVITGALTSTTPPATGGLVGVVRATGVLAATTSPAAGALAAGVGVLVSATTAQAHAQAVDAARTALSTVDGTTASGIAGVPLSGASVLVTAAPGSAATTANGAAIDVVDGGPGPTQTALPGTAGASAGVDAVHRLVVLQPMPASAVGAAYPAVASGLSPRTPLHAGAPRVTIGRGATVGVPVRRMLVHAGSPNLS